ncbi:MAG: CoA pyrophosphatase, partial [Desulfobacterales bacterium]|nr:CoA pyrophosphatase [Desulfobacterales bacterium]
MNKLDLFTQILRQFEPNKIPDRRALARAGVAGILKHDEKEGLCVMLVKRAEREGDPWSGHMAFPGGRMEKKDSNVYKATIREVEEETGLDLLMEAHYIGRLSDLLAKTHDRKSNMVLTAFIFSLEKEPEWHFNYELLERVWIPLDYFKEPSNRKKMDWQVAGNSVQLPCYYFEERVIWGLTLSLIDELIKLYK